jgi:hypothetical protein
MVCMHLAAPTLAAETAPGSRCIMPQGLRRDGLCQLDDADGGRRGSETPLQAQRARFTSQHSSSINRKRCNLARDRCRGLARKKQADRMARATRVRGGLDRDMQREQARPQS